MRRLAWVLVPLLGWSLACGGLEVGDDTEPVAEPPPPDPRPTRPAGPPPNVLLVVIDDLGTDKVSAFGEHPDAPPTPTLDGLAREGLLFRNAYGYPEGAGTRASLLTGRYARRYGLGSALDADDTAELPVHEVTLPEALTLAPAAWHTAAVGKWGLSTPMSAHSTTHPVDQGFGSFQGTLGNLDDYERWDEVTNGAVGRVERYAPSEVTDDALAALRGLDEPFFVLVGYHAPHRPLHTPPEALLPDKLPRDADDATRFDAAVTAVDAELGRLLAGMLPAERARTLVVVLGDNGTDRRGIRAPRVPDEAKGTLSEGGVNVPLIVTGPGIPAGAESPALVHAVDLFPTVAELAGVSLDRLTRDGKPVDIDGVSQVPALYDLEARPRPIVYVERFRPLGAGPYDLAWRAARDERYKLVDVGGREPLLYDLQGRHDDGPSFRKAQLTPDEQAHWDALQDHLDLMAQRMAYEHGP